MATNNDFNLDEETIKKVGLTPSDKSINAPLAPHSKVFAYPHLENVFIMESDLYGNPMPAGSCFLAFYGTHGLMGKHLRVEALKNATVEDIKKMVETNIEG